MQSLTRLTLLLALTAATSAQPLTSQPENTASWIDLAKAPFPTLLTLSDNIEDTVETSDVPIYEFQVDPLWVDEEPYNWDGEPVIRPKYRRGSDRYYTWERRLRRPMLGLLEGVVWEFAEKLGLRDLSSR